MLLSNFLLLAALAVLSWAAHSNTYEERATPTCTYSLKNPLPTHFICGKTGHVKNPAPISTSTPSTQDDCRDGCKPNKACISFSYSASSLTCIQYSQAIEKSDFVRKNSGIVFFNRHCFAPQCGLCPPGQTDCGGDCVDKTSDPNNCGVCSNVCLAGSSCQSSACECADGADPTNLQSNDQDCGACDNVCPTSTTCQSGACKCPDGSDPTNLQSNNQDCGTCGNVCQSGSTCQSGGCTCADGATTSSLQTNVNDCGTCGNNCIGSGAICSTGQCMCSDTSKTYCPQVGCTSTLSFNYDSNYCGRCGVACANGQICSQGGCITDPGTCNNRGVQWAYLANVDGVNNDNIYSTFAPEHYSSGQPILDNGQIQQIGSWTDDSDTIYNTSLSAGATFYVMNHRGYIFAPLSGSYTITIDQFVDDIACFWISTNAYSGYTRNNAAICKAFGPDTSSGPHQTTVSLVAGNYYPFRVMYAQAQLDAFFTFNITHASSGLSIISGTPNSANPWVIQQGCAGVPPAFEPFGSEN